MKFRARLTNRQAAQKKGNPVSSRPTKLLSQDIWHLQDRDAVKCNGSPTHPHQKNVLLTELPARRSSERLLVLNCSSRPGEEPFPSAYRERLDSPHNRTVLRHPLDTPNCGFEFWRVGIVWNRNVNLHIVGRGSALKLTLGLKRSKPRGHLQVSFLVSHKIRTQGHLRKMIQDGQKEVFRNAE